MGSVPSLDQEVSAKSWISNFFFYITLSFLSLRSLKQKCLLSVASCVTLLSNVGSFGGLGGSICFLFFFIFHFHLELKYYKALVMILFL